jgi:transcriptional regulator with XRE-family HTH domain
LAYDRGMRGGEVIRRARTRAYLTTEELAERLGVTTSTLTEWEGADPSFSLVERAVVACGADLAGVIAEPDPDPHDLSLLDTTLRMTVEERVQRLVEYVRFVQAGRAALRGMR